MLRIDADEEDGKATMKIAGQLGGPRAEEVRRQVLRCKNAPRVVVDLSEVTFIDNSGEECWRGWVVSERSLPLRAFTPRHLADPAVDCAKLLVKGCSAHASNLATTFHFSQPRIGAASSAASFQEMAGISKSITRHP